MSTKPAFSYGHRVEDTVVVQDLTDWDGETEGMERVESEWLEHARRDHVTAALTEFGAGMDLGPETQEHLAREWTDNAVEAGLDRIAFVSEGIQALAVSANLDVPHEVRSFDDFEAALEWAKGRR